MTDTLARLRQLEAAATPGPWRTDGLGGIDKPHRGMLSAAPNGAGVFTWTANADLTVAARNALPQLLDIAEAADRELNALAEWAGEQNAGNAFATQVRLWALTKLEALAALDRRETG